MLFLLGAYPRAVPNVVEEATRIKCIRNSHEKVRAELEVSGKLLDDLVHAVKNL